MTYYDRVTPDLIISNVTLEVIGTPGATAYRYQVSAYNWNGETLACDLLSVSNGNANLSISHYNLLEWLEVEGAVGYRIYGRTAGVYGLLGTVLATAPFSSGSTYEYKDQGQSSPVIATQPPVTNTSGRDTWDKLLFNESKALQSAELNEVQSILADADKRLGESLFREGGVIKGCSPSLQSDAVTIIIPEGQVFIKGKIRDIATGTITITGSGSEIIGLLVTETIVTFGADAALSDPAIGTDNYNKDGADRRVYSFTWVANNPNAIKVFDVQEGAIIVASSETDYAQINKILATRTFEESGNYVVEDTPVIIKEDPGDSTKLIVKIDAIRAYVQGYRVERTKGTSLSLNKARDFKNVAEEQFTYAAGSAPGNNIYRLANYFVKDVNQLFSTVEVAAASITKGTPNGQDFIHTSLVALVTVAQGGTTYTTPADYIRTGNYVDWGAGGVEPVTGTTYTVTYTYRKEMTNGTRIKTRVTDEAVTKGSANAADNLANSDLINIVSVCSAVLGGGTVYTEDVDWYKVDGQDDAHIHLNGQVHWNLPGAEPTPSAVYYVTYDYWNHTVEGEFVCAGSYDSYEDIGTYSVFDLRDCIDFRHPVGYSGDVPEDDNVNVDYDYYISRRDLLIVNTKGELLISEGVSDDHPARPKVKEDCMAIADIRVQSYTYTKDNVDVTMTEVKRSTMEDIRDLTKRISTMEYYQGLDLLEKNAIDEYTVDAKTGVLVDNFRGSSRADLWYNRGGITFGVAFDTKRECIQIQAPFTNTDLISEINAGTTTAQTTGKMVTLPYTNVLGQSQPFSSQMVNVTPYLVFPMVGEMLLDPAEDYWVDTTQAPDLRVATGPTYDENEHWIRSSGWQISASPWEQHITGVTREEVNVQVRNATIASMGGRLNWTESEIVTEISGFNERKASIVNLVPETMTRSMGNRIIDTTIVPFIRSRIITIIGHKLRPSVEIALKMDDQVIAMIAIAPTTTGAHGGCVNTDSTGYFKARFTIPAGVFNIGEREIRVYNYDGLSNHDTSASTVYNAYGIAQTRQNTYVTSRYLQPKVSVISQVEDFKTTRKEVVVTPAKKVDPLAQTFIFDESFFLTRIGLYFATKDPTLPCTIEIRTVDNGYPGPGVLSSYTLYPSSITTSANASSETLVTLPEPVFIEKGQWYCVAIKADTTNYNIWVATMGGTDVTTGGLITKQPHDGVFFRSSNNTTWVADPNSDIKFKLYRANFSLNANLIFDTLSGIDASILNLITTEVHPGDADTEATNISWVLDDDPVSTYDRVLKPNETTYLGVEITDALIKGVFTSNNVKISPVLNLDRIGLVSSKYETGTKSYITRNVDVTPNNFDNVKIVYEANKPNNTNVRVYLSTDDGYVWVEIASPTSTATIDKFWTEFQYLQGSLAGKTEFRIRIDLISTTTGDTPRVRKLRIIAY